MTDSQGRTVSFKNTILIMTSNLGSQAILEGMAAGVREQVKDTVMSLVQSPPVSHKPPQFPLPKLIACYNLAFFLTTA